MNRRAYLATLSMGTATFTGCTTLFIDSEDVTPYQELSNKGQQLFNQMLDEEAVSGVESDFPSRLWAADYIRFEETVYAIERDQTGQSISEYSLEMHRAPESRIESDAEIVKFEDLSMEAQDTFRTAQVGRIYSRERFPEQLHEYNYIEYQNEYYELEKSIGHLLVWELSVSKTLF